MKTTRQSFFTSLVAVLLLISMFVGTTFAWFTDIVTSEGNIIKSGTLDIELMKGTKNGDSWDWTKHDGTAIFDYDKWEPGYTTFTNPMFSKEFALLGIQPN